MFKINLKIAQQRLRTVLAFVLALGCVWSSCAQVDILRNSDDQFIQDLREQGMSDLLKHMIETDPPKDPINRLVADVNLKQFIADDLLARASEANMNGQTEEAIALFNQSRQTFDQVIAAQKKLVEDHDDDERIPLWQTDLAEMLIDRYLPRYYQNIAWHYEFGIPNPEQAKVFEDSVVLALKVTSDAAYSMGLLANRVGADEELRNKLEEMGIWFRLDDYRRINGPYWFGHAAHYVSLLPDDHAYYQAGNIVRGQQADVLIEKNRLRNRVVDAFAGPLSTDPRTELTAKLISGRTLVWSNKVADNDDGIDLYLEEVIQKGDGTARGFLAKLGKAVGRWKAGELDTAEEILGGMPKDKYVRADGSGVARLLSADLLFRILTAEAKKAVPSKQPALIAAAYEKAYIPLIGSDQDPRFRNILFERWAADVGDDADPTTLPATVRMGIGERLPQQGGGLAQEVMGLVATPAPAVPSEVEAHNAEIKTKHDSAKALLEKAAVFNKTLVGDDMQGTVLANGLYNLGMNKYWLAKLATVYDPKAASRFEPFLEAYKLWVDVADRAPEADRAQNALVFAVGLLQGMDIFFNAKGIQQVEVRDTYARAFDLLDKKWPTLEIAHNNRVYAGFQLYEKTGDFDRAIKVYRALPPEHKDYFQARRQMIYVMQRDYRQNTGQLQLLEATAPNEDPPPGANAQEIEKVKQARIAWEKQRDAVLDTLTRQRAEIVDDAELIEIDAEDQLKRGGSNAIRFTAATALAAARVVLSGMLADEGKTKKSLEKLQGFEQLYDPKDGKYVQLAKLQAQPESALQTLQGLIQTAQQQRIISLLDAGQTPQMATQAKKMMDESPDVAASVVNGVLKRIQSSINVQERIKRDAPFKIQRDRAQERIEFFANAAVSLGELLVQWAQAQGFDQSKMVAYRLPLAESLMLAGRAAEALKIMKPIVKEMPNNFEISMKTGKAYIAVYAQGKKDPDAYNGAMQQFTKIILYYNQRPEKPDNFWEAWYQIFRLLDVAGKPASNVIPERARMLIGIDENLGGPAFKDKFMDIINRHGGVERLQPSSSSFGPSDTTNGLQPVADSTPTNLLPLLLAGVTGLVLLVIVLAKPFSRRPSH